jgi:para-nitrobenzyl esterase
MAYWVGTLRDPTPQDRAVSATLQAYLLNFVRKGDPNGAGLPAWPSAPAGTVAPLLVDGGFAVATGFRDRQLQPFYRKWEKDTGERLGLGGTAGR